MNKTIVQLFESCVAKYAQNPFLWERDTAFQSTSYAETSVRVHQLAGGLLSLGLKKDDKVALLSEGCNAWVIGELAILHAGAVNVPLSIKLNEPADLVFRIQHSDARFVVVSISQLPKIRAIRSQLEQVEAVLVLGTKDATGLQEGERLLE
ncbi:MAG: AMP-binding protein, partial [Bacteroidales bacterium]|nr:AMP-binding protein [Bacteroidales bacterium]